MALFAAPKVVKSDYKVTEFPYKNYGLLIPPPVKIRPDADGIMVIGDQEVFIFQQGMFPCARPGDAVATSKGNLLYVASLDTDYRFRDEWWYRFRLKELKAYKKLCGVPVIMIDKKWRQYKAGKNPDYEIVFKPIFSTWREV